MQLTLVVQTGDASGKRFVVPDANPLRIGRQPPAEVCVLDDPMLSGHHFSIELLDESFVLRDHKSRFGTQVNGKPVMEAPLADGDTILAGRTKFTVEVIGGANAVRPSISESTPMPVAALQPNLSSPSREKRNAAVLKFLREHRNLYALLDAARNPAIYEHVKKCPHQHQSLYDGEQGEEIAPFGPWLVELPIDTPFLEVLIGEGWGDSWGVYLTCASPFSEVRRQLRRFLLAKLPDGREVYFRYYDPRVLRTYLQTCTPTELGAFFGPITNYFSESADENHLLAFAPTYKEWRKIALAEGAA
jgi:hypothetical protein